MLNNKYSASCALFGPLDYKVIACLCHRFQETLCDRAASTHVIGDPAGFRIACNEVWIHFPIGVHGYDLQVCFGNFIVVVVVRHPKGLGAVRPIRIAVLIQLIPRICLLVDQANWVDMWTDSIRVMFTKVMIPIDREPWNLIKC